MEYDVIDAYCMGCGKRRPVVRLFVFWTNFPVLLCADCIKKILHLLASGYFDLIEKEKRCPF